MNTPQTETPQDGAQTTRRKITLPSGATCVVRALSLFDWATLEKSPKSFPGKADLRTMKEAGPDTKLNVDQIGAQAAMMEAMVLHCCSPLTFPDGRRVKVVTGKELDELGDDEIALEELAQDDCIAIVNAASELSKTTKEAGESAGNFPAERSVSDDAA